MMLGAESLTPLNDTITLRDGHITSQTGAGPLPHLAILLTALLASHQAMAWGAVQGRSAALRIGVLLAGRRGVRRLGRRLCAHRRWNRLVCSTRLPTVGGSRLDFIRDFRRVNRRMHNKLIVTDNAAAIVGGRNIGDI